MTDDIVNLRKCLLEISTANDRMDQRGVRQGIFNLECVINSVEADERRLKKLAAMMARELLDAPLQNPKV